MTAAAVWEFVGLVALVAGTTALAQLALGILRRI